MPLTLVRLGPAMRFDVFNHGEEKHAPLSFVQSTNGLITLDSQLLRQSRHLRGGKYLSDRFSERQPLYGMPKPNINDSSPLALN